jgi:TusA-related sulfurtransferase
MVSFDLRDALIPFSLLQIANAFRRMGAGEVMEILADNAEITTDLQRILPLAAYDIFYFSEAADDGRRSYRLRLKKNTTANSLTQKEDHHV